MQVLLDPIDLYMTGVSVWYPPTVFFDELITALPKKCFPYCSYLRRPVFRVRLSFIIF